jgi:hypothetical protein
MAVRKKETYNRKIQNYNHKVEDAQLGCPRPAPSRCAGQEKVNRVQHE